jgi:murein DD-endopeptidase MepM/ murein hydrolase activator NlpD
MAIIVKPNTKMLPYGAFASILALMIYGSALESTEAEQELVTESSEVLVIKAEKIETREIHVVQEGENLSVIFEQYRVPLNSTYKIFRKDKSGEIKNIMPGDRLEFIFYGELLQEIKIIKSTFLVFEISISPDILIKKIKKISDQITSFKSGIIQSSFYLAGLKEDIPESVIMDVAYIFGWDIDFIFDIRAGDKFRLLYETSFIDGVKVKNGSILFAEFFNGEEKYTAVRFKGKNKPWDYFNKDGGSLEKAFLRAPLDFAYVSSHFNPNRRHPILNKIRAHNGVDYAAKRGTPIRATGEGVIESIGWKGGYGRTIVIKHGGEITTLYAHMEKYHSLITKGSKVQQGQTIGYVGDSGLATAPHLHYEFRIGNKRTDPLKVPLPSASPLKKSLLVDFQALQADYVQLSNHLLLRDPNEAFFK